MKTVGDFWRSCTNEELATNMVDFFVSLLVHAGISEDDIDLVAEYNVLLDFFNTEYENPDNKTFNASNGYSYIN